MRRWAALVGSCAALALLVGCSSVEVGRPSAPPGAPADARPSGSEAGADTTARDGQPGSAGPATFAVIGDYGMNNPEEDAVAALVRSWKPEYVLTVGDDYYRAAGGHGTEKYDESTGAYYCAWLKGVSTDGDRCPAGEAATNSFFPALGNHDYADVDVEDYLDYFDLPGSGFSSSSGSERYYDFVQGPVHFFVLDSNPEEPDGITSTSKQARWLRDGLAASTSRWNVVYDHHPPYSSDTTHGPTPALQWPYAAWGADAVLSGHAHVYERILRDGIVYLVNGLGGAERMAFGTPVPGSAVRYSAGWGALKGTAGDTSLTFEFVAVNGTVVDSYTLPAHRERPTPKASSSR